MSTADDGCPTDEPYGASLLIFNSSATVNTTVYYVNASFVPTSNWQGVFASTMPPFRPKNDAPRFSKASAAGPQLSLQLAVNRERPLRAAALT